MIYLWNVQALFEMEVRNRYLPFLSKERIEKVNRVKSEEDKARSVGAGILLQEAYRQFHIQNQRELANANSLVSFDKADFIFLPEDFLPKESVDLPKVTTGAHGKPGFASDSAPFFSITHAKNWVAVAMEEKEVGLDLEMIRKKKMSVIKRCFDSMEQSLFHEEDNTIEEDALFTEFWTKKEAMSKLDGRGISFLYGQSDKQAENRSDLMEQMLVKSCWLDADTVLSVAFYR